MQTEDNVSFRSFGREAAGRSVLFCPRNPDEIKSVFAGLKPGQRVVIRGGGHSFHDQALHDGDTGQQVALSTEKFKSITFAPDGDPNTVQLGAGVQWIEYFNAAVDQAKSSGGPLRLPGSLQTGRQATAGGTMSGDCLSRFSAVLGKESRWIESFRIVLTDGTLLDVNRNNYPDLFFATIGGHGYLGCVIDITYRLIAIDPRSCARTAITTYEDFDGLVAAQLRLIDAATHDPPPFPPRAISSVWFTDLAHISKPGKIKGGVFDSTYAPPSQPAPMGFPLYADITSHWRYATELMARVETTNMAIHEFLFLLAEEHKQPFENDLMDFLFFMDGNTIAKQKFEQQFYPKLFPIVQQTFVVPRERTVAFATNCESKLSDAGLRPTETDMLFVAQDDCLMSANFDMDGFAVSLAFEPIAEDGQAPPNVVAFLKDLTRDCVAFGGRIHLVKNIYADPEDFKTMFNPQIVTFEDIKRKYDPPLLLQNPFSDRLFQFRHG